MDKRLLRYAGGGGAISLLACGLLCMALGALAGGDVAGLGGLRRDFRPARRRIRLCLTACMRR